MAIQQTIGGNDIAQAPQGAALQLVLQELRVISQLLYNLQRGRPAHMTLEFMRAEQALDGSTKATWY
jgi:hypothetical protein